VPPDITILPDAGFNLPQTNNVPVAFPLENKPVIVEIGEPIDTLAIVAVGVIAGVEDEPPSGTKYVNNV
jgi:hypothetical protein